MPPTSMLNRAQRPHEPARLRALLALVLLLSGGTGLAALAQDAYGGITGANYPNPYPQGGTYFSGLLGTPRTSGAGTVRIASTRRLRSTPCAQRSPMTRMAVSNLNMDEVIE